METNKNILHQKTPRIKINYINKSFSALSNVAHVRLIITPPKRIHLSKYKSFYTTVSAYDKFVKKVMTVIDYIAMSKKVS